MCQSVAIDLPQPPLKPDPQECCDRGCCPCIFDYYYDAMARWEASVREMGDGPQRPPAFPSAG